MRKIWTLQEVETLRRLYPDCKTVTLENIFHRTASVIGQKAASLGIYKSEGFMKSPLSGRISKNNDIGAATRFAPGLAGWNKGKKQKDYMSPEMIERTKQTRFKKGQDPHNSKPIGYERISRDGYLEVKVQHLKDGDAKNKNFKAKHRIIFEDAFGPIPEGMNVEFLDGDKFNFELSNLVLRSKKENLLNNSMCDQSIVKRFMKVKEPKLIAEMIEKYPYLIELQRNIIKTKSKLNEINAKTN
jgi:hypothetical protein